PFRDPPHVEETLIAGEGAALVVDHEEAVRGGLQRGPVEGCGPRVLLLGESLVGDVPKQTVRRPSLDGPDRSPRQGEGDGGPAPELTAEIQRDRLARAEPGESVNQRGRSIGGTEQLTQRPADGLPGRDGK